ncbi:MAG: efflux RND transporter permease subunit [Synergistaceae bacterium]|nr:efflux RND transporter permease subunit [Synergistaceae bacterium]
MDIARASIKRFRIIIFLCLMTLAGGVMAYFQIGKLEDPSFTIKTAVISAIYPGASAYEVEQEVTARIEDAVQAMGEIKHIRSRSTPELAIIYVDIKDEYTSKELPQIWDKLRQKVNDAQVYMPTGATIIINNDFGEVYGQYYALVGDGYTMKELYDYADFLKKNLVLVPGVASVKILGEQTEGIYIEFSASRMSNLGLSPLTIFAALTQQNTLSPVGNITLGDRYIRISPTSAILSVEDIDDLIIGNSGGNLTRLREIAAVRRDYVEPQTFKLKFNNRPALAIGISTVEGGNVVNMGRAVSKRLKELEAFRPVGIELNEIYMQSDQVVKSTDDFLINLAESLFIVVGVLLIFMGLRSGLIIGLVLLITVAGTFTIMNYTGITLQIVSLAALIIALGSLVDNGIVVAEGMLVGVERGKTLEDSASDSVESSKWAMLGGTVIAVLAFAPVGLSKAQAGEFLSSLFSVVGISMILSWFAALIAAPVLGKIFLKPSKQNKDPYDSFLFRAYKYILECCLRNRFLTVTATIAIFIFSMYIFSTMKTSFFPDAETVYFNIDLWSPEGVSLQAQERETQKLADYITSQPGVKNVSQFIGGGGLRFMLTYSPPEGSNSFSQLMVEMEDAKYTREMLLKAQAYIDEKMLPAEGYCRLFARGSGMSEKIGARFYGEDPEILREIANKACEIMRQDSSSKFVRDNWRDKVEVIRPQILKDQMQALGLGRPLINFAALMSTTGITIGSFREGDKSLSIYAALIPSERNNIELLSSIPVWSPTLNKTVPLGTVFSNLETTFEDNIIMRRDRSRYISAMSEVKFGLNADEYLARIKPKIEALDLPFGYTLEWGGEHELSDESMAGMAVAFPAAILIMFIIMIFLFNGFRQTIIIFISLPLILIGVVLGLWLANMDVSFLAVVGLLSLVGMLAKNSIVLLDQVSADFAAGRDKYESIVEDGVARLRPVAMSAFTTVLGMIPLIWDVMFGPMAVTIMAGLTVSTILTLLVIPVLTAIFYNVPCPDSDSDSDSDSDDDE